MYIALIYAFNPLLGELALASAARADAARLGQRAGDPRGRRARAGPGPRTGALRRRRDAHAEPVRALGMALGDRCALACGKPRTANPAARHPTCGGRSPTAHAILPPGGPGGDDGRGRLARHRAAGDTRRDDRRHRDPRPRPRAGRDADRRSGSRWSRRARRCSGWTGSSRRGAARTSTRCPRSPVPSRSRTCATPRPERPGRSCTTSTPRSSPARSSAWSDRAARASPRSRA